MPKDLTISNIDRQNVLNNKFALKEIQKNADIKGVLFEEKIVFTKEMIARFYSPSKNTRVFRCGMNWNLQEVTCQPETC